MTVMGETGSEMTVREESVSKGGKECGSEGGGRQQAAGTGGEIVTEAESGVAAGQRAWGRGQERGGNGDAPTRAQRAGRRWG